jgi:hypothetical protein
MIELFHRIDEAQVIVRRRGVFKQVPLYRRGERVYALLGGGYVRLLARGASTQPDTMWEDIYDPRGEVMQSPDHINAPKFVERLRRAA